MATKIMNFKMDEAEILEVKEVAEVFNMTATDLIKKALRFYLTELKRDPYYRLTLNVKDASEKESAEILCEIDGLTDDDLTITSVRKLDV